MEFVTLKKDNTKKVLLVLVVFIAIVVTIVSLSSRAKYQVTSSAQIVKGTVNYKPYDFKIVEIRKENDAGVYELTDEVPTTGYEINEKDSKCMINDTEQDTTAVLKTINGNHTFANLKKMDKCTLYFSKEKTAGEQLLSKRTTDEGEDGFTNIDIDEHTDENGKSILYSDEDDFGTTYYFRGKVKDNWVKFGQTSEGQDIWWRIIRINGNGSIRMIYTGTGSNAPTTDGFLNNNGTGSQLQTNAYNEYYNDNKYIGYMYGTQPTGTVNNETTPTINYDQAHENNYDSDIKKILDNWYSTNLKASYAQYIDPNSGFCNDRKAAIMSRYGYGTDGYGNHLTAYAAVDRLLDTNWNANAKHTPTFKCARKEDTFTLPDAKKPNGDDYGNHKLKANNGKGENSPIGLITIDEAVYAGGYYYRANNQSDNKEFYLYTGQYYWTMSPYSFYGTYANMFYIHLNGNLNNNDVNNARGVRPVINLSANVKLSGDGTKDTPYEVS